jgi:PTS system mannose-specific IIA component
MIGMVLVTHDNIGVELLKSLNTIVGPQKQAEAISIGPHDDMEKCRDRILTAIKNVNNGKGVVLLVDMFGGTPSNLAISMMNRQGVEVISGVNLPMLVKLAKVRSSQNLDECVDCAQTAGRKYIAAASHVLPSCKKAACG